MSDSEQKEAYMTFDGVVYKLSPIEQVKATTALAAITKRAHAKALSLAKDAVQASIDALLRDAKEKRKEAVALLAKVKTSQVPPPVWAVSAGIPIKYSEKYKMWCVQMVINFSITHYDFEWGDSPYRVSWKALPNTKLIMLWVPLSIGGQYTVSTIVVDENCPQLPHVGHDVACMAPDNPPQAITSVEDLARLTEGIERTLHRVNLSSIRVSLSLWYEMFKSSMPEDLRAVLDGAESTHVVMPLAKTLNFVEVNRDVERIQSWKA